MHIIVGTLQNTWRLSPVTTRQLPILHLKKIKIEYMQNAGYIKNDVIIHNYVCVCKNTAVQKKS